MLSQRVALGLQGVMLCFLFFAVFMRFKTNYKLTQVLSTVGFNLFQLDTQKKILISPCDYRRSNTRFSFPVPVLISKLA